MRGYSGPCHLRGSALVPQAAQGSCSEPIRHHGWAIDFQLDQTVDSRRLKFLNVIDKFCRTCLAIRVGRRSKVMDGITTIDQLLHQHPAPTHQRMNNDPNFIASALQV